MSTQSSKYDHAPKNFDFIIQQTIKQTLSAIPCYVSLDAFQADPDAWRDILTGTFDRFVAKHIVFYVDVATLTPDCIYHGRLTGQFINLDSPARYHELIRRVKQEKLKALVAPK